jgi:hypothetical protein
LYRFGVDTVSATSLVHGAASSPGNGFVQEQSAAIPSTMRIVGRQVAVFLEI